MNVITGEENGNINTNTNNNDNSYSPSGDITPDTDSTRSLGTSTKRYKRGHFDDVHTTHITFDYSDIYPSDMLAPITVNGGINKCWGQKVIYLAGGDLLAGRVVSLQDQAVGTDDTQYLKVGYIVDSSETYPSVCPIGITQHDCLAGEKIVVCTLGYTTAISYNSDSTPERGSQVMSATTSAQGKVYLNNTGGSNEGRMGFVAQSNAVSANGPVLIYFSGWYQPY